MKILFSLLVLLSFISFCYGWQTQIIPNTRKDECVNGRCRSFCAFDGAKILPGRDFNQVEKCRVMTCTLKFEIMFTVCPFDMTGETRFEGSDYSKPYPECCGRVVPVDRK